MLTDLRETLQNRDVSLRTALASTVVTGLVLGAGGYLLGHDMGEGDAGRAEFVRAQQSVSRQAMVDATENMIKIEQETVDLLTGKAGSEVDLDAVEALHQQYTTTYNVIIGERGRMSHLYGDAVRQAARSSSTADNVALEALFPEPGQLEPMTALELRNLVNNSITARKAQWVALRKFSQLAMDEMTGKG